MKKFGITVAKLFKADDLCLYHEKALFKRACVTYMRTDNEIDILSLKVDKDGKQAKEWHGYIPMGYDIRKIKDDKELCEYRFYIEIPEREIYKTDDDGKEIKDENGSYIVVGYEKAKMLFYTIRFLLD